MPLTLEYRSETNVPVEVNGIVPNLVENLSLDAIRSLPIFHGNRKMQLSDLFTVSGDSSDKQIDWIGDCSGVHWIGAKMESGTIRVHGNAGRHVGSEMKFGEIIVNGDAGDWVGGEMQGGLIRVRGRAGHLIGAAYRGSRVGMKNGTILIDGSAGNEIGHTMRRGLLVVGGNIGDLAGFNMRAGTILVLGDSGIRHGAGMRRGTIGLLGTQQSELLPTFRYGCRQHPTILKMLFHEIRQLGFEFPDELMQMQYKNFHGDLIEGGRGEIWVRA